MLSAPIVRDSSTGSRGSLAGGRGGPRVGFQLTAPPCSLKLLVLRKHKGKAQSELGRVEPVQHDQPVAVGQLFKHTLPKCAQYEACVLRHMGTQTVPACLF